MNQIFDFLFEQYATYETVDIVLEMINKLLQNFNSIFISKTLITNLL